MNPLYSCEQYITSHKKLIPLFIDEYLLVPREDGLRTHCALTHHRSKPRPVAEDAQQQRLAGDSTGGIGR